jgi:hypothetical protein
MRSPNTAETATVMFAVVPTGTPHRSMQLTMIRPPSNGYAGQKRLKRNS